MVEIRVAVSDATRVHGLMRSLAELFDRLFDRSSVSFDGANEKSAFARSGSRAASSKCSARSSHGWQKTVLTR
jgi:hypothetical protein